MKVKDIIFILCVIAFFAPFFLFEKVYEYYNIFNTDHGMIMSFIKFALLATLGESIGLRIRTNQYNYKGFGLLSRAIVWGFLGLFIKIAFVVYAKGMPMCVEYLGLNDAVNIYHAETITLTKVIVAFSISAGMNLMFAPVFMVFHKITDSHIVENNGNVLSLIKPIAFGRHLQEINWNVQWNFVFKKTIPLFWIPAHTGTFLLPPEYRILVAALLSIVLGVIMAIASSMQKK